MAKSTKPTRAELEVALVQQNETIKDLRAALRASVQKEEQLRAANLALREPMIEAAAKRDGGTAAMNVQVQSVGWAVERDDLTGRLAVDFVGFGHRSRVLFGGDPDAFKLACALLEHAHPPESSKPTEAKHG